MIFVSLADASRRLGIDAKTLRRWRAAAQLPLQSHPSDGRKKGMSDEHLQVLAHLHHRSLAPRSQQPASVASQVPPLPAALLALPQTLCALQVQVTALQQQVADLTRLLEQHGQGPASPAAPTQQTRTAKRSPKPAPAAPHSRSAASPAAKPPRKPAHVLPRVEYGSEGHYVVICPKQGRLVLEPDSPAWLAWLAQLSSFRFVGKAGRLTAHREVEHFPRAAWRAHRKIRNHTYNLHLGPTEDLTIATLEQAAAALQAHLK